MIKKVIFISVLILAMSGVAWWGAVINEQRERVDQNNARQTQDQSSPTATRLVSAVPLETPAAGYLGSDSCKECHADYHQSWHLSYHRTMTQPINPQTAPAVIADGNTVDVDGTRYQFLQRDDRYWVTFGDEATGVRQRELVMMTGSHHMHVFWVDSGIERTPAQLPIVYLLDQQQWIPRRSAFLRPADFQIESEFGRWNSTCSQCHSTHPRQRPVEGANQWDTEVAEFGISCEACHGPGEEHVKFHQHDRKKSEQGTTVKVESAEEELVDPLKLASDRRSDICARCHSIGIIDLEVIDKDQYYAHGLPFRPGQKLDASQAYKVVRASPEHIKSKYFARWTQLPGMRLNGNFWPDGHVRISGRDYSAMIESACYQQGDMTCLSCHTMHQQDTLLQSEWRSDQLKPKMNGDDACLQCHADYKELGSAHTHHPIDSSGSRCMNCHMPYTVYGLLKTIRSHTISSPSVASTIHTTRPNACNLCHLDHTLAETSQHLADWYGHEQPELTDEEQQTAASLLQLLKGDAAQRALQVAAYQWPPAQQASGTDWMRPYVLLEMTDPYEAIRIMAWRGYRALPGVGDLSYDFLAADRNQVVAAEFKRLTETWDLKANPALLITEDGEIDETRLNSLLENRNQRTVYLQE